MGRAAIPSLLILVLAGCGANADPTCPSGSKLIKDACRLECADHQDCLITEACEPTTNTCLPESPSDTPLLKVFTVEPELVPRGGQVEVRYAVLFADSVELVVTRENGPSESIPRGNEPTGNFFLGPVFSNGIIELFAEQEGRMVRSQAQVRVGMGDGPPPLIVFLEADPGFVEPGGEVILRWEVLNPRGPIELKANGELLSENLPAEGQFTVYPFETTNYRLQTPGPGMQLNKTARVQVR